MDLHDTPDEQAFRRAVRAFIERNQFLCSTEARDRGALSGGDLNEAAEWQGRKAEAGLAGILLPQRFGGRGGTAMEQIILSQEERAAGAPSDFHFMIGLGICAPTLVAFGREAQCLHHIPPMIRGDAIWCQLFSEPSGGSDLAAARTLARRDGNDWVINGQKIWTSGAQYSDFGLLLARTDKSVPKHQGLSVFILDMKAPGVDIRPIKQISGLSHFNEVFLSDVRIVDGHRVGELGEGWRIAVAMLMNERLAVSSVFSPDIGYPLRLAQRRDIGGSRAIHNAVVRDRLGRWYCEQQGVKHTMSRVMNALSKGREPGPEASIIKIVDAARTFEMASFALDLLGPADDEGKPEVDAIEAFLEAPGRRIGGGTEEILLNLIAERILKLPGDVRTDKNIPFDQLSLWKYPSTKPRHVYSGNRHE